MKSVRRRAAAAAALLAVLSLAACGIQESDVVEAGGAATVIVYPQPEFRMVLYFLGPDGQPVPVAREVEPPIPDPTFAAGGIEASQDRKAHGWASGQGQDTHGTPVATDKVLAALLSGPSGADTAAGLTTGLPRSKNAPRTEQVEGLTPEGRRRIRLRLPFPVMGLSDAAVQQLVCTTAYAEDGGGRVDVTLISIDGTRPATRCET
ncbi:hypothetical protein [Streptomyces vietnamensis]|uniref:hypothetical protein n=1 Tax=Streptomyces vietnamensis TaxID=362257 RepID=UPI00099C40A4|nr:hypothetical protein [Streptomyces vietnamensis]